MAFESGLSSGRILVMKVEATEDNIPACVCLSSAFGAKDATYEDKRRAQVPVVLIDVFTVEFL